MTPKVTIITPVWNQEELIIRALDSIPRRDDIEVIVYDDGSTDNTFNNVRDYRDANPDLNLILLYEKENKGIGYAKNKMYEAATGEYIHQLDSDDYLYTKEYEKAIAELDGTDIVYINLITNSGVRFAVNIDTRVGYCAGLARFIRREFLGATRCREIRGGEDWYLNQDLLAKTPTEKFTDLDAYHYNFPREGSLFDLMVKGKL